MKKIEWITIPGRPNEDLKPPTMPDGDGGDEDDPTTDRLFKRTSLFHTWLFIRGKPVVYWPARRIYHPDHDPGDEHPTVVKDFGVYNYGDLI
jgi:hypothetical protein